MTEEPSKKTKFHCNSCGKQTNHEIVGRHELTRTTYVQMNPEGERSESMWSTDYYELLKCLGCDEMAYRHSNYFSEDWDAEFSEETGTLVAVPSHVEIFPPRQDRSAPNWIRKFSKSREGHHRELASLFEEIYAARGGKANRLAAIGARTALDVLLTHKVGDKGSFADRLKMLTTKLGLTKTLAGAADSVINIGNAAAHRGTRPTDEELSDLLDLVEEILKAVYVTPEEQQELERLLAAKAERIKLATPPRPQKKVTAKAKS